MENIVDKAAAFAHDGYKRIYRIQRRINKALAVLNIISLLLIISSCFFWIWVGFDIGLKIFLSGVVLFVFMRIAASCEKFIIELMKEKLDEGISTLVNDLDIELKFLKEKDSRVDRITAAELMLLQYAGSKPEVVEWLINYGTTEESCIMRDGFLEQNTGVASRWDKVRMCMKPYINTNGIHTNSRG